MTATDNFDVLMPDFTFTFMAEIEDQIFENAALNNPKDACNLSLISRRVQPRIEAIMYETIIFISHHERFILHDMTYVERFETVLLSRPASFFATHVRNVCITNTVPKATASLILSKCSGIKNLAVWQHSDPIKLEVVEFVGPLAASLESLSIGRSTMKRLAASGHIFTKMKYLAVGMHPLDEPLSHLQWVPALTTLQLRLGQPDDQWFDDVETALSSAPQLQKLILDVERYLVDEIEERILSLDDRRITVRDDSRHWGPIREWKAVFGS